MCIRDRSGIVSVEYCTHARPVTTNWSARELPHASHTSPPTSLLFLEEFSSAKEQNTHQM